MKHIFRTFPGIVFDGQGNVVIGHHSLKAMKITFPHAKLVVRQTRAGFWQVVGLYEKGL